MEQRSIFEQISEIARLHPNVDAIIDAGNSTTYSQLIAKAENISLQLFDLGCEREERIPIVTRGGADMVAAMIACLQVAATFVPIDISAPVERTVKMLQDLGCKIIVADEFLNVEQFASDDLAVVRPSPNGACSDFRSLNDNSIIYGFFTSGSTGAPKCCLNTHRGLANRFAFNSSVKSLQVGESVLQNSKHTFDPVLWQTLWPLTRGATVIIPERDGLLDIERTINTIEQRNVVMTDIVPSVLTVLLDYLERHPKEVSRINSLAELFVGGEETSIQLLHRVRKTLPWLRLTNTYGPTEAAIGMIYHHFDGSETTDIPLGKPISGTTAVVLDEELRPVAEGQIGQLAIGGACLGTGYHNDQEKTNKAFKLIQLNGGEHRLFLTGDRALVQDGNLYFRGRTDKQIKIRGVRVELKEIEAALEEHPDVVQLRVVPISTRDGETTLYAYLTANRELPVEKLRQFANDRLPKEFIPNVFTEILEFKTTTSGKIDRSHLKQMAENLHSEKLVESTDDLQAIIRELTGLTIKKDEDLFSSGLDSLNAMRLALEVEERFSCKISASRLYANPTIEEINRLVRKENDPPTHQEPDLSRWFGISVSPQKPRNTVLLTGATGYFGIHLLAQLSQNPAAKVVCMVRSTSEAQAMSRLHRTAFKFAVYNNVDWDNVETILGDLTLPGLGVTKRDRDQLVPTLSAIYNAAAEVNFVKPFSSLEQVNVRAVVELAELAASASNCHLHHVSSTAVIQGPEGSIDGPPNTEGFISMGGYAQSKLAAEIALKSIHKDGLSITVYRVGELMPSPTRPVPNPKSLVVSYLRTMAFVGMSPADFDSLDYCPVDIAVQQLLAVSLSDNLIVGLANQNRASLSDIIEAMNRSGARIVPVPRSQVHEAIRSAAIVDTAPDYVSVVWSFIRALEPSSHWPILSYSDETREFRGAAGTWPEITGDFLTQALRRVATQHDSGEELTALA